jgi:hypothetical protein
MTAGVVVADSRVMITRCLRRSRRDPEAFFTALMLPIILMLLFVYVFGGDLRTGGSYVNYVVPGLIVLCAGFGAGTTAVSVATDMTNGIVDRFRSMPIWASALLVGHVAASLVRNMLATALVICVAIGIGWRPTGTPLDWMAATALVVRSPPSSRPYEACGWAKRRPASASPGNRCWPAPTAWAYSFSPRSQHPGCSADGRRLEPSDRRKKSVGLVSIDDKELVDHRRENQSVAAGGHGRLPCLLENESEDE